MKNHYMYCLFLLLSVSFMSAQDNQKAILDFQQKTNAVVTLSRSGGIPDFVRFPTQEALHVTGNSIEQKSINFIVDNAAVYNFNANRDVLEVSKTEIDTYGLEHVVLHQFYGNVPVYDGKLHFHYNRDNKLTSVNGNFIDGLKLNPEPIITELQAQDFAVQVINDQNLNFSGTPLIINKNTLYIFQKGLVQGYKGANHLVYEVEVTNKVDVREFVFVDAHSGLVIEQFTGIAHAVDRVISESTRNNIVWQEGDAFPGSLTIWQQNEVVTSGHMYNLFNNAFGYSSYDGADAQMRTINNANIGCPNATWNGFTANFCDGTASDDVVAHEWGHAYTGYTSGLIYAWQSGAMNESYSDIWGETVDLLNNYDDAGEDLALRTTGCNSDRWKIGEAATAFGNPIRDLWNPPCNGDPGRVTSGQYWCSTGDSGGVHINSGIPNHAYALLVDGGTYNGQTISGLGFTKAAHIFWRAQSQYLTATSGFAVLADALEASANDLIGVDLEGLSFTTPVGPSGEIITANDVQQVMNAVLAVELRINPDACGFTPILQPLAEELCEASTNNPVFMEDWESGLGNWTLEQLPENPNGWQSRDWAIRNNLPNDREGNAIFGIDPNYGFDCNSNLQNGIIRLQSPVIALPDYPNGTFDMAFNHNISTEPSWDGANIKYSVDGGAWTILPAAAFTDNPYNGAINPTNQGNDNPMASEPAFTGADGGSTSGSWGTSVIDLSQIGGVSNTTVQFRFEMGTDGCNGSIGWFIDEISIYNCTELLSVNEFDALSNLVHVFPNPSNGIFTIKKLNAVQLKSAEVYDINGRLIKTVDLSTMTINATIDLSQAASGMYFMSIESNDSKTLIKLIKS